VKFPKFFHVVFSGNLKIPVPPGLKATRHSPVFTSLAIGTQGILSGIRKTDTWEYYFPKQTVKKMGIVTFQRLISYCDG
jgi:hypothetical protein